MGKSLCGPANQPCVSVPTQGYAGARSVHSPAAAGWRDPAVLPQVSTHLNLHVALGVQQEKKRKIGFHRGLLLEEIEKYVFDISEDVVLTRILIVPDVPQMSKGTRH